MARFTETSKERPEKLRTADPFMDRRSGEDRSKMYSPDYFELGNHERRKSSERRDNVERRQDCFRVSEWSSVCPGNEDFKKVDGVIII
jgi:hypothetical protein